MVRNLVTLSLLVFAATLSFDLGSKRYHSESVRVLDETTRRLRIHEAYRAQLDPWLRDSTRDRRWADLVAELVRHEDVARDGWRARYWDDLGHSPMPDGCGGAGRGRPKTKGEQAREYSRLGSYAELDSLQMEVSSSLDGTLAPLREHYDSERQRLRWHVRVVRGGYMVAATLFVVGVGWALGGKRRVPA